ncbi:DENN domain-containing protein 11-like [Lytechinus variegatus]|uniref:DENN domain-containing protein 11-like n=1 Tax=Lytechinus variegatus TaxID=7654 RepID=UPI001BB21D8C|nr:DENN domain-containing protein 11-like [Lytechinus variegatus]
MATSSDKSPLLVNIEDDSVEVLTPNTQARHPSVRSEIGEERKDTENDRAQESDDIVAIFVVAFDTRSGNIVEWCLPNDINLDGVEFKAMASGSHTVLTDFIYFRKDRYYGLSCFENMHVESAAERGARMKSVGVLSTSYTMLHRHMKFLEHQVRHLLHSPGRYEDLEAFFSDHKASLPLSRDSSWEGIASVLHSSSSPLHQNASTVVNSSQLTPPSSDEHHPHMKITHPAGCFSQFLSFFGEQIFTLWKFILLRKRVLFFSPPPIGVVCYKVYCASLMSHHDVILNSAIEQKPYFYVNIADIDTLESEMSYIACTTEKIFQEKQSLYDVYVDNQNVTTHAANLKDLLRPNEVDKEKFMRLNNQRATAVFNAREQGVEPSSEEDDEIFANFFLEQNNHIFQTLHEISSTEDKSLTNDHMKAMGLDPIGDRAFIVDLLELYGIDVILMIDAPCCPV